MLSSTAEYALRAVLYLAEQDRESHVPANEMASVLSLPANYLGKILNELVRARLLASSRGKHGGYRLAVEPEDLSLLSIVSRFDRFPVEQRCLLGRTRCSELSACRVHRRWRALADQLLTFFTHTTVAELLAEASASASAA